MHRSTLSHSDIAQRIPHAGNMCLLSRIVSWDERSITAVAINHRDTTHPLRSDGKLSPVVLVEYAAQAMAVHGSLAHEHSRGDTQLSAHAPEGRLVSVRQLDLHTHDLSTHPSDLIIRCELLLGDTKSSMFAFTAHADQLLLGQGRASVMLIATVKD